MPTCPNCKHEWKQERKKREVKVEQITFNSETKKFEGIANIDYEYWYDQFPAVDVDAEVKKMEAWLYANPKNRKSKYVRFITNWLSKAQDKAPRCDGGIRMKGFPNVPSWKQGPV